jgi:hypothetical protein
MGQHRASVGVLALIGGGGVVWLLRSRRTRRRLASSQ